MPVGVHIRPFELFPYHGNHGLHVRADPCLQKGDAALIRQAAAQRSSLLLLRWQLGVGRAAGSGGAAAVVP